MSNAPKDNRIRLIGVIKTFLLLKELINNNDKVVTKVYDNVSRYRHLDLDSTVVMGGTHSFKYFYKFVMNVK